MSKATVCTSCDIPLFSVHAIEKDSGDFCPECCNMEPHVMSVEDMLTLSGATHIRVGASNSGNGKAIANNLPCEVCLSTGPIIRQKHFTGIGKSSNKAFNIAYQRMQLNDQDGSCFTLPRDDHETLDDYLRSKSS